MRLLLFGLAALTNPAGDHVPVTVHTTNDGCAAVTTASTPSAFTAIEVSTATIEPALPALSAIESAIPALDPLSSPAVVHANTTRSDFDALCRSRTCCEDGEGDRHCDVFQGHFSLPKE